MEHILDRSPLDFIACSHCFRPHSSPPHSTFLTACGHTVCAPCLAHPQPPDIPTTADATCPACGERGAVAPLDQSTLASDVGHCFKPLATSIEELGMAAEWQMGNLARQVEHWRTKCAEQKKTISKAMLELKKGRGVKDSLPLRPATQNQNTASRSEPASTALYPGGAQQLPLAPSRLSFTPAQTKEGRERARQNSRQGLGGGGNEGRRSKAPGESVKERLAQFAYNPSRTSHRPPATVASTPGPSRVASHSVDPRHAHDGAPSHASTGSNPFFFNPPRIGTAAAALGQGEEGYYAQQQQQQQPMEDVYEDEHAMLPPQIPATQAQRQHQPQPMASPFVSARQLQVQQQQQQQQQQGYEQQGYGHDGAQFFEAGGAFGGAGYGDGGGGGPAHGTRSGAFTPLPTPTPTFTPRPATTPSFVGSSSHRQPFRPAGGRATHGGGGGGGGYRFA
ncbi:hypothetical protein JCM10207_007470 [Rhodosporidiobolus poonsookiae]